MNQTTALVCIYNTARLIVILLIIWKNTGYYLIIYLAGLSSLSAEVNEAARIDGANSVQIFFRITLPLLRPITVFLIVTSVISGFRLFDEPFLLFSNIQSPYGGPERSCLTVMMYFFDKTFKSSTQLGYGAAVSYALFIILLAASILVSKLFSMRRKEW
jgi:cellobiose transport system permease protein